MFTSLSTTGPGSFCPIWAVVGKWWLVIVVTKVWLEESCRVGSPADHGRSRGCKHKIAVTPQRVKHTYHLVFVYFVFLVFANDCTSRFFIFFILQLYSSYKLPPWDHNLHWQQLGKSSFCSHIHKCVLSHKLMKLWSWNFETLSVAFWGLMASKAAEWVGSISQTQCWPPGLHCLQGANHPPHILTNHQLLYYTLCLLLLSACSWWLLSIGHLWSRLPNIIAPNSTGLKYFQ